MKKEDKLPMVKGLGRIAKNFAETLASPRLRVPSDEEITNLEVIELVFVLFANIFIVGAKNVFDC